MNSFNMNPVSFPSRFRLRAFTLIELLTVIAIIGILAAITIPTVSGVRNSAKKTKTRIQFTQWAAGIRTFKQVYGFYPRFEVTGGKHKVNGGLAASGSGSDDMGDADYLFRELLTGKGAKPLSGSGFEFASAEKDSSSSKQNPKRQAFVSFDATEIAPPTNASTVAGGLDLPLKDDDITVKGAGAVIDSFGNVDIAVIVDRNNDGFINDTDLATGVSQFPTVVAKRGNGTLQIKEILTRIYSINDNNVKTEPNGVRGEVIFYSPGKGFGGGSIGSEISPSDAVWSW
jgi:prepilin-type N-terminal cleavage/methylation domain-containing protein